MLSVLCVLHSNSGTYSPTLVNDATRSLTALHHTLQAGAPDFIPSLFYVSRADPGTGPQCLYASQVPDSNHAVLVEGATTTTTTSSFSSSLSNIKEGYHCSNVVYAPFAGSSATEEEPHTTATTIPSSQRLYGALQHRSPALMLRSVYGGIYRRPATSTEGEREGGHPLNSLAGALLAALCYYRRYTAAAPTEQQQGSSSGSTDSPASRALLLVFTDYEGTATVAAPTVEDVPFSVECALAAAAQLASPPADEHDPAAAAGGPASPAAAVRVFVYGRGAQRSPHLRALAASTAGGWVKDSFAYSDLGAMLHLSSTAGEGEGETDGQERSTNSNNNNNKTNNRKKAKRARVVDHYVLAPATLPAVLPPPAGAAAAAARQHKKKKGEEAKIQDQPPPQQQRKASHLGWLCPRCMAVVYRAPAEVTAAPPQEGGRASVHTCPYCLEG